MAQLYIIKFVRKEMFEGQRQKFCFSSSPVPT